MELLIERGARKGTRVGVDGMPPICIAAARGYYQMTQFLIDNKCRVNTRDKFKRTPLILACRNGHSKLASLLLQRGAHWDEADSSGNTPLQYACAYGWHECIELLLQAGADVNLTNSWNLSATNIAMLKNHFGAVK